MNHVTPDPARVLLPVIVLAGAGLRGWLAAGNAGLTMDSPLYVNMAEALAAGHRALGPAHHGYSALIALAGSLLPGRELPGRAISFVAGVALIPLVFLLARRVASTWGSLVAAGLAAAHPLLAVYSGPIMTETTFLAVALASLLLIERGRPLAGGLGLGLGYVVRPEAMVVAVGAMILARAGRRAVVRIGLGFVLVAAPYVGYLSWERGATTLSPKTVLIRPPARSRTEAEWRVGDARPPANESRRPFVERVRREAPAAAARYLPRLGDQLARLTESWPWPLLAVSLLGLAIRAGPAAAPLLQLLVLPLLAVGADIRFTILFLPTLAVYAAAGGAWCVRRWGQGRPLVATALLVAALAGTGWAWAGRAGGRALAFDDGPMAQMREAGAWLREHGRRGATVMDRKAYVPFYAGMRHVQLPDDEYETVIRYAISSGVDYLVLEEFVVETLRPQLLPLIADARFRSAEHRLRVVHHVRNGPHTGVAVMEVVR